MKPEHLVQQRILIVGRLGHVEPEDALAILDHGRERLRRGVGADRTVEMLDECAKHGRDDIGSVIWVALASSKACQWLECSHGVEFTKMPLLELPHTPNCLVCGRANPHGLHLSLHVDPASNLVTTTFTPTPDHIGFEG